MKTKKYVGVINMVAKDIKDRVSIYKRWEKF